jgi:hypothetical protein
VDDVKVRAKSESDGGGKERNGKSRDIYTGVPELLLSCLQNLLFPFTNTLEEINKEIKK